MGIYYLQTRFVETTIWVVTQSRLKKTEKDTGFIILVYYLKINSMNAMY